MSAPLRVVLSEESKQTLQALRIAPQVAQHIKDRAHMVRLNAQGWNVPAIAKVFECREQTVRETLRRWETGGLGGLWDAPGRGMKPRWCESDMQYLEDRLEQDPRTYNSEQLSVLLVQERGVKLSADRIRRILQKRGGAGSALVTAPNRALSGSSNGTSKRTWTRSNRPPKTEIST
jgi:transposase